MEIISFPSIENMERLAREYEEKLALKDRQITDLNNMLDEYKIRSNTINGINEMLKIQLVDILHSLESTNSYLTTQIGAVRKLVERLP